jgi:hypothetical protein
MGRSYPRFLLSKSTKAKSKGTFIIHTLDPAFLAEPFFDDARRLIDISVIDIFGNNGTYYWEKARAIASNEIPDWWKYCGIHESTDKRDILLSKLSSLSFLRNSEEYTVEDVYEMIKIIYPTKAKRIYKQIDSYGIKHDFERISTLLLSTIGKKYCTNDTVKAAFSIAGFESISDGPNEHYNISEGESNLIRKIGLFAVNNSVKTF